MRIRFYAKRNLPRARRIREFARAVCRKVKALAGPGEINVIFVSDAEIKNINRKFLGENRATDVIAFPYEEKKGGVAGDVFVSLDTARSTARSGKYSAHREVSLLVLHGLLHLAGYDDHSPRKKARMWAAQKNLFRAMGPDLAPPDFL